MNGLSREQVANKNSSGKINKIPSVDQRTVFDILKEHLLTWFNFLCLLMFLLVMATGSYKNTLFMGVVIANAVIGIVQEYYLKRKLDALKKRQQHFYTVVRDGKQVSVTAEEIVESELLYLTAGEQIPCDMKLISSDYLEVNEALITGESEPVWKTIGDSLVSGSFVVSGACYAEAVCVGGDTYYARMIAQAGKYKRMESKILDGIQKIIQLMSLVILPLGVILFLSTVYRDGAHWRDAVLTTAASVIGMIPSGLYLITTITAGTAVLKLAKKKALVTDFSAVERLSRVTTVCLDKTGTLTTGEIQVEKVFAYDEDCYDILKLFCKAFSEKNPTLQAIDRKYGSDTKRNCETVLSFSSERKYSQLISDGVSYRLGAVSKLVTEGEISETANQAMLAGGRVLALCKEETCMALIVLSDVIKETAGTVLDYFRAEQIDLKIISGDHPKTVSAIAKKLGFRDAHQSVDLNEQPKTLEHYCNLVKEYSVFGGVTPEDKQLLVRALRTNGETVAMGGDGVNDVPALKEADLSIAMASGAQAAKAVSQVVLTESDFGPLPDVLREGRRIVNNVERVAGLYLMKTGFSLFLTVFFIIFGMNYPFSPIGMTVIGSLSIGIPSFFLALEENNCPVKDEFLPAVFRSALPVAVLISLFVGFFGILEIVGYLTQRETLSFYLTAYFSFFQLVRCSHPLSARKAGVIMSVIVIFFICLFVPGFVPLSGLSFSNFLLLGACLLLGSVLLAMQPFEE